MELSDIEIRELAELLYSKIKQCEGTIVDVNGLHYDVRITGTEIEQKLIQCLFPNHTNDKELTSASMSTLYGNGIVYVEQRLRTDMNILVSIRIGTEKSLYVKDGRVYTRTGLIFSMSWPMVFNFLNNQYGRRNNVQLDKQSAVQIDTPEASSLTSKIERVQISAPESSSMIDRIGCALASLLF